MAMLAGVLPGLASQVPLPVGGIEPGKCILQGLLDARIDRGATMQRRLPY